MRQFVYVYIMKADRIRLNSLYFLHYSKASRQPKRVVMTGPSRR